MYARHKSENVSNADWLSSYKSSQYPGLLRILSPLATSTPRSIERLSAFQAGCD